MNPENLAHETRVADVVVIGSGAAGLSAVLALVPLHVDLLTKGSLGHSGASPWAQGGVAAAWGKDDSPEAHAADTLAVAGGIGETGVVKLLTQEGPERIRSLVELGAHFDRSPDGEFELGREAAHSHRRIVHAGDATGAEIVRVLTQAVLKRDEAAVFERTFACELAMESGRVVGVYARHADGRLVLHRARAVVLATGGLGRLYLHTTNPKEATGDGIALAWRAGATLADLEFVQFHPTALASGDDPMPLLTEALRGAGARLIGEDGLPLITDFGSQPELLPRDVLARALWQKLRAGHRAFLDARHLGPEVTTRFPTVTALCRARGLDLGTQPIPVAPAAHYHMGGIWVDAWGHTSLPGLWACGEVAATGVHGANRLASNSLLEALVFGDRVAKAIGGQERRDAPADREPHSQAMVLRAPPDPESLATVEMRLRRIMWEDVGLVRDAASLRDALAWLNRTLDELPRAASETHNMVLVAKLIATAALERSESRGSHFRSDYPESDPQWQCHVVLHRSDDAGSVQIELLPVSHGISETEPVLATPSSGVVVSGASPSPAGPGK